MSEDNDSNTTTNTNVSSDGIHDPFFDDSISRLPTGFSVYPENYTIYLESDDYNPISKLIEEGTL